MAELTTLARPYAKAAFVEAQEKSALDVRSEELSLLSSVASDSDMLTVLAHPALTAAQHQQAVLDVCGDKLSDTAKNLVAILADNKRLALLPEIAALFEEMKAELQNTVDVTVISAIEIAAEQMEKMVAALKARLNSEIRVTTEINADLIGGAIIRAGDLVIDGSVSGKLSKLAEAMKS